MVDLALRPDGSPEWYNVHGSKMRIRPDTQQESRIRITSSEHAPAASLRIHRSGANRFILAWTLKHTLDYAGSGMSCGSVTVDGPRLAYAFGVAEPAETFSPLVGVPGIFERLGDHLNVPCRGTGRDGDPNISVFLTDEIRSAVDQLLQRR